MDKNICNLSSREDFIKHIIANPESKTLLLVGPSGSGKKYMINSISSEFKEKENTTVLEFIDDQLICKQKKYKNKKTVFELNAAFYVGVSISFEEKNQSKLNNIVTEFKGVKDNNIVIIQSNVENLNENAKQILDIIVNNHDFIESNTKKNILVLCTTEDVNEKYISNWKFNSKIKVAPYTKADIIDYLICKRKFDLTNIQNYDKKMNVLFELSNGNLNLVNIICEDVLKKDISYGESLSKIVDLKIANIKKKYANDYVSEKDLEDIILTCSLCVDFFNREIILYATKKAENQVKESLIAYSESKLIINQDLNKYQFITEEVKEILKQKKLTSGRESYIDFYNYVSLYKCDSYYDRAYYLMKYYECIEPPVFDLYVLALTKAYSFNDFWKVDKIKKNISEYSLKEEYIEVISHLDDAYRFMLNKNYSDSIKELQKIDNRCCGKISRSEINRLMFRNYYYSNNTNHIDCIKLVESLKIDASSVLKLSFFDPIVTMNDEYAQRLQIIYDIAPCIIDDYNDFDEFEKLYETSLKITRKMEHENLSTYATKYMLNIFNRKAFLFSHPMSADTYYEEAKSFFYQNKVFDEYCITLVCYAGTLLASSQYEKALGCCDEAISIIEKYGLIIPTPEKLYNNYNIANFLNNEVTYKSDLQKIKCEAKKTAYDLFTQAQKLDSSASKHVMLTNVASLSLYSENYGLYNDAKKQLEISLNCSDVSDVNDGMINDFYRYHFAWFDLFYNMQFENWEKCKSIFANLENFVPALFKKTENLWTKKNKAVKTLIDSKKKVDSYYFCNKLVSITNTTEMYNNFYYRGLPLSDLQYTSYS